MLPPRCSRHRQPCGWKCKGCGKPLCPDCVALQRVQTVELELCVECGELVEPLRRHRAEERSFLARLPGALWWPLSKAGLVAMLMMAATRAAASYFFGLGWWLGVCALVATCFMLIRSTARGSDDFEVLEVGDVFGDLLMPGIKLVLGAALVWAPALAWLALRHPEIRVQPLAALGDPMVWVLWVAGVLYAPMALLAAAGGSSMLSMLNPVFVVSNALRLGPNYVVASAALVALSIPNFFLLAAGAMMNLIPIPLLPRVLDYFLASYIPFVAARVMGLLLLTHGDKVGYGLESDYWVPAMGQVAPRGVLTRAPAPLRHSPIELDAEVEAPAPAAPEPVPAKLTELDPALLPPWKEEE